MMKKRWLLRLGLLAGLALFGFWFVLWLTAPEHRITEESWHQIKRGMSFDEVVAILGATPGDHATSISPEVRKEIEALCQVRIDGLSFNASQKKDAPVRGQIWIGDTAVILVFFNRDQTVNFKWCETYTSDTFVARIRRQAASLLK